MNGRPSPNPSAREGNIVHSVPQKKGKHDGLPFFVVQNVGTGRALSVINAFARKHLWF